MPKKTELVKTSEFSRVDVEKYGGALKKLKLDPPLPPPAPGVESVDKFAERLARALCIVEPMPAMVIEILRAVRDRDAAVVKAKDDEAYAASQRAATRTR